MSKENRLIALSQFFNELYSRTGKPDVRTFAGRFDAQKAVYLVQAMGEKVGNYRYRFDKYFHGPYSSQLATDIQQLHFDEYQTIDGRAVLLELL